MTHLFLRIWNNPASRTRLWAVATLLLIAFAFRVIMLNNPANFYFDEVYHGYTALQYTKGNPDAYDPWGTSEKGFANEWSHPPLAKLIMASGIVLFGEHSWAWRVPSAVFGTLSIGLLGLLTYQLTKRYSIAFLAMTLLTLEGLHLVMSRIAMNDIFFITFLLATLTAYLYGQELKLKKYQYRWFAVSAIALGLALASKWTALYLFGVIGLDQIVRWIVTEKRMPNGQEFVAKAVFYSVIPAVVYVASYAHMFWLGFTWEFFITLQKQMWWYHTSLEATHGYQSQPWQWLLNLRPVWMTVQYLDNGRANIYALGNPVLLWSGLVAVALVFWRLLSKWSHTLWFVLLCYGAFWIPWVLSPRIMFFYHYLPSTLFLIVALALTWQEWLETANLQALKQRKMLLVFFIILAASWLGIFFPHLASIPIPIKWSEALFILPSWR